MSEIKILVIEDDENVRNNIFILLEEERYKVDTAENGNKGIEKALVFMPDLIICDILMPVISGYDVLKELSKHKETRSIPFIFLTAKVERNDIRLGMELGADDYLFKPFKSEELLNSIKARLNKYEIIIADTAEKGKDKPELKKNKRYDIDEKLFLTENGKPICITIREIKYIIAVNQYTSIKLISGKSILIRRSIKSWENSLPMKTFIRIHRCTIINMNQIVKMEKWHRTSMVIYLKDVNDPFITSKRYTAIIKSKNR